MLTLGVLCSGSLGFHILTKINEHYNVKFILTDHRSEDIIKYSKLNTIAVFSGNPRGGKAYAFIKNTEVDVIISINYLYLIEDDIFNHSKKLTFNIHGSLLPKYRGRTPHVWAIINGEKKTGITAHLIDAGCDTGKIIDQVEIPIEIEDTGGMILEKYLKEYFPLITKVLKKVALNKITLTNQIEKEATYFGKRTPNDGEIDWSWGAEKIRNWVRAQAKPYPGAFTFYDQKKIIIDKVSVIKQQKSFESEIGEILETNPNLIVKAGNDFIKLEDIRTKSCNFKIGKKFSYENRK